MPGKVWFSDSYKVDGTRHLAIGLFWHLADPYEGEVSLATKEG